MSIPFRFNDMIRSTLVWLGKASIPTPIKPSGSTWRLTGNPSTTVCSSYKPEATNQAHQQPACMFIPWRLNAIQEVHWCVHLTSISWREPLEHVQTHLRPINKHTYPSITATNKAHQLLCLFHENWMIYSKYIGVFISHPLLEESTLDINPNPYHLQT